MIKVPSCCTHAGAQNNYSTKIFSKNIEGATCQFMVFPLLKRQVQNFGNGFKKGSQWSLKPDNHHQAHTNFPKFKISPPLDLLEDRGGLRLRWSVACCHEWHPKCIPYIWAENLVYWDCQYVIKCKRSQCDSDARIHNPKINQCYGEKWFIWPGTCAHFINSLNYQNKNGQYWNYNCHIFVLSMNFSCFFSTLDASFSKNLKNTICHLH